MACELAIYVGRDVMTNGQCVYMALPTEASGADVDVTCHLLACFFDDVTLTSFL